jgi:hypothetical protein
VIWLVEDDYIDVNTKKDRARTIRCPKSVDNVAKLAGKFATRLTAASPDFHFEVRASGVSVSP